MGKAEAGSSKALANAMKSKGLQRLRWYCQCRDENGFKCHTMSEGHLRQMLVVGESAGKHISDYSSRFQAEFIALLSRRWGTKRTRINQVYQEYISDKNHLHMNATRWMSLTEFCKHLGRTGIAHVDETEKGWYVSWIDNSPRALAKAEANQKKERGDMDDETRQRKLIQEQIERARREGEKRKIELAGGTWKEGENGEVLMVEGSKGGVDEDEHNKPTITKELNRAEGEKVSLNFSFKLSSKPIASSSTTDSTTVTNHASPMPSVAGKEVIASGTSTPIPPTEENISKGASSEGEEKSKDAIDSTKEGEEEAELSHDTPLSLPSPPLPLPESISATRTTNFIAPPPKISVNSTFTPKANVFKVANNALKANPLKRANPLKMASVSSTVSKGATNAVPQKRAAAPLSAVEQIFEEEMARKNRSTNGHHVQQRWNEAGNGVQKRQRY